MKSLLLLLGSLAACVTGFVPQQQHSLMRKSPLLHPETTLRHKSSARFHSNDPEDFDVNRRNVLQIAATAAPAFLLAGSSPPSSSALTPEDASESYDTYAASYDDLDGGKASSALGLDEARAQLFKKASGRVLEIGVGTGLNLAKYDTSKVTSLTLVDISEGMIQEAKKKVEGLRLDIPVEFIRADATSELEKVFGGDAFDTVVDSFSLCVMGNEGAKRCLEQVSKVVKSGNNGGRVLLLENTRSDNNFLGWYQDLTADTAATAGGKGCVYNQNVALLIRKTGGLTIMNEIPYVAGLFKSFECIRDII